MKKQIFILSFLVLAIIVLATNSAKAQFARPLDCAVAEGPLNPLLGKTYTYSVTVPNVAEFTSAGPVVNVTYQWRVTTDQTFITNGAISATPAAATDYTVASGTYNTAAASNQISLSWNVLATETNPLFLLVNVVGDNGDCDPQNLKVYKIVPVNQFTLDLANVDASNVIMSTWETDGSAPIYQECVQNVQSAVWNPGTQEATYDYGSNTLVWAVTAANFTTSWTPSLQFTGINAGELIESVKWSRNADGTGGGGTFTKPTAPLTTWTTTDVVTVADATTNGPNVGATGEVIYISLVLDHTDVDTGTFFEGLVDQPIVLAIDGVTANGDDDVHYFDDPATPAPNKDNCGIADGFTNDKAEQDLKARPGINTNTLDAASAPQPLLAPVVAP